MENKEWKKPESIELSIEKNPPVRTYLHHAFLLSILHTNEIYKLFYEANFIQLVYEPQSGCPYDFHEYYYRNLPYFLTDRLDDSMTKQIQCDINEFVSMQIVNRYYCIAWVDAYYLPGELFYQKKHITHGILIYKYDDKKREYTALGYSNENSVYSELVIPYDCFTQSYKSDYFSLLDFLKINLGVRPLFEPDIIKVKLKAYLNSQTYDLDDIKYHPKWRIESYGRKAGEKIIDHLEERKKNNQVIDLRWIYLFLEHKKSIGTTINALGFNWNGKINTLCDEVLVYSIKYNITKKMSLIEIIINLIEEILHLEEIQILEAIVE